MWQVVCGSGKISPSPHTIKVFPSSLTNSKRNTSGGPGGQGYTAQVTWSLEDGEEDTSIGGD
jgi:hypothetical protein